MKRILGITALAATLAWGAAVQHREGSVISAAAPAVLPTVDRGVVVAGEPGNEALGFWPVEGTPGVGKAVITIARDRTTRLMAADGSVLILFRPDGTVEVKGEVVAREPMLASMLLRLLSHRPGASIRLVM